MVLQPNPNLVGTTMTAVVARTKDGITVSMGDDAVLTEVDFRHCEGIFILACSNYYSTYPSTSLQCAQ